MKQIVLATVSAAVLFTGCFDVEDSFDEVEIPYYEEAPTGAKVQEDAFGNSLLLDEECGYLAGLPFEDYFQHAMFRDGAVSQFGVTSAEDRRLWLVDGANLWFQAYGLGEEPVGLPQVALPLVGQVVAVASLGDRLITGSIRGELRVYFEEDLSNPVTREFNSPILDVAAVGNWIVVATGNKGIHVVYASPAVIDVVDRVGVAGFASGVRIAESWSGTSIPVFYAACETVGVLRLDAESGRLTTRFESGELSHRNAKDAHGFGDVMAVANNGRGLWVADYQMNSFGEDPHIDWTYHIEDDPLFYANSVYVGDDLVAYLAAGNQSLQAYDLNNFEPIEDFVERDPINVEYDAGHGNETLIGLGNFRKIGERTIVYAGANLLNDYEISEPRPWAHFSTSATSPDTTWLNYYTPEHGLRTYAIGQTGEIAPITHVVFGFSGFDVTSHAEITSAGEYLYRSDNGNEIGFLQQRKRLYVQTTSSAFAGALQPLTGDQKKQLLSGEFDAFLEPAELPGMFQYADRFATTDQFSQHLRCDETEPGTDGLHNVKMRYGTYVSGDSTFVWCSRHLDPWIAEDRPRGDAGTRMYECRDLGAYCELHWVLPFSGTMVVQPHPEGWMVLVDDRRSGTGSLLLVDHIGNIQESWMMASRPAGMAVGPKRTVVASVDDAILTMFSGGISREVLP